MIMDDEYYYHGIIIEQSLRDKTILNSIKILGKKEIDQWTLLKVSINSSYLQHFLKDIQQNLIEDENGIPYYAHFYKGIILKVVFPFKIFHVTTSLDTWTNVIEYGRSIGIPESQLDFFPNKFSDESF